MGLSVLRCFCSFIVTLQSIPKKIARLVYIEFPNIITNISVLVYHFVILFWGMFVT